MRSVSATLEAAQIAASRTPYIHLLFTSYDGLTTYDLSTDSVAYGNRILLIDQSENAYSTVATIALRNYDDALDDIDLTGYWVEIGYGDTTGAGDEYIGQGGDNLEGMQRMWVKYQQTIKAQGKRMTILSLEGMWEKLTETQMRIGEPPYYIAKTDAVEDAGDTKNGYVSGFSGEDFTVYDIINYILTTQIDPAMTLDALGGEDDSIIDTYVPVFTVNEQQQFDNAGNIIYTLIKMTACYLRPKDGLAWKVIYPEDTESEDITYYIDQDPQFYSYIFVDRLVLPNQILLFANRGTDGLWNSIITATPANNADSQAKYGVVPSVETAPEITTQADADNRAEVILARYNQEQIQAQLIIPHDCRIELYDFVAVDVGD